MKKFFMTLACAVIALTASAQRASSSSSSFFSTEKADLPVTFGIRGGLNVSSMSLKYDDDLKSRAGFNVGVAVDFPIMESFYVQSGLYYTVKGYKVEEGNDKEKVNIGYLEIPILASYRYNFNDANQLQFNFGPYLAYGLHGKDKWEEYYNGRTYESDKKWYDYDDTKRFDMGLQLGLGVTLAKHYYVGIAYEFGLLEQVKDSDGYYKNRNFMVNVGYQF
ncbi:MAG: PorT family protein [Prevotella sp.]|nr:PorT family protein [Prevotella sp.]